MHCGARLEECDRYCPVCGLRQWVAPAAAAVPAGEAEWTDTPRPGALLTWSLILFFLVNPIGTPLAAIAMLLTALGHTGDPGTAGRLRTARTLCIVAGVADVITLVLCAVAVLVRFAAARF